MVRESTREDVAGLAIEYGLVEKMRHSLTVSTDFQTSLASFYSSVYQAA